MGSVYHRIDKRTGNTYAYESTSFRHPETEKVRTHQTYLGRVDPVTGKLIPKGGNDTRRRAPSDRAIAAANKAAHERIRELEIQVESLTIELERTKAEAAANRAFVHEMLELTDRYRDTSGD